MAWLRGLVLSQPAPLATCRERRAPDGATSPSGARGGRRRAMRRSRLTPALMALLAAPTITACTDGSSSAAPPTTTSTTTATIGAPSRSSVTPQERATEDARAAYLRYRRTLDEVFQRGGKQARADLPKVASGQQLQYLLGQAAEFERNGWQAVGSPTLRSISLDEVALATGRDATRVVFKICDDATTTDAVDRRGRSIRSPGALAHFRATVTLTELPNNGFLVTDEQDTPVKSC